MRGPYQILMPLFSIFLVRVDLTDLYPLELRVQVVKIYDGDTVLVKRAHQSFKVRLSKIDSPEKGQRFLGSFKDAGEESKECMKKIINEETTLKLEKNDIYGRILGDLDDLNFKLIESGCSSLYPMATFKNEKEKYRYLHALKKAKAQRVGLWKYGGFVQPKLYRKLSKRNVVQR